MGQRSFDCLKELLLNLTLLKEGARKTANALFKDGLNAGDIVTRIPDWIMEEIGIKRQQKCTSCMTNEDNGAPHSCFKKQDAMEPSEVEIVDSETEIKAQLLKNDTATAQELVSMNLDEFFSANRGSVRTAILNQFSELAFG